MKVFPFRGFAPTTIAAVVILLVAACYQGQISHLEFETARFGMIPVNNPAMVRRGMVEYQELSEQNAVVFDHGRNQTMEISSPKVRYHVDVAFINADCRIVRVLTGIPPEDDLPEPEDAPQTKYSSGYPARYLAVTVAPKMQEIGVLPGQKVKFTGPAQRMGCD